MTSKYQEKYPDQEPGVLEKVDDKIGESGDVVQSALEAAGHYGKSTLWSRIGSITLYIIVWDPAIL